MHVCTVHIYHFRNKYSYIHIIHITTGAKAGNPSVGRAAMSRESLLKHITTGVCTYVVEVDYWTDYVICTGSQL